MKRVNSIILCLLLFSLGSQAQAQGQYQKVCDTIPYEIVYHKIVIPVEVNGKRVKFIVDTGGQTALTHSAAVELGAKQTSSRPISDFGGKASLYGEGEMYNVQLSPNLKIPIQKIIITPNVGFFKSLGVVGLLSGDVFANCVISFDSQLKIMVINYPYRPLGLKVTDGMVMDGGQYKHTVVKASFSGVTLDVLFDTGAHGFLMLTEHDYSQLKELIPTKIINTGFGIGGVGIGGPGKPGDLKNISVSEIDFMGKKFLNAETTLSKNGSTILGVDVLNYGKVIIDYARNRFYFLPFDDSVIESVPLKKSWNISILPMDGMFKISAVWSTIKNTVSFGEQVISINGTTLDGLPLSQLVIDDMMDEIKNDSTEIVLKDPKTDKTRKVTIFKE